MSAKTKYQGYEHVDVGGVDYLFKSDFAFLSALDEIGVNTFSAYASLGANTATAEDVLSILVCGIQSINGVDVIETEKRAECENLITGHGLQECYILAQYLLSYGMIGDIKKSRLQPGNLLKSVESLIFQFGSLKNQPYLWVYIALISGLCACINFSLYALLTS